MRFWEEYRFLIGVAGGFLFLWLVAHLVFFGPHAEAVQQIHEDTESAVGDDLERFFPESGGTKIRLLQKIYDQRNAELSDRLQVLVERLSRPFPDPLYPPEKEPLLRQHVREEYRQLRERLLRQAGNRGVAFSEQAALLLGNELPDTFEESRAQDLSWLRQMLLVREFVELTLNVSEEPDGGPANLLEIVRLAPGSGGPAGPVPTFFDSHPLEAELVLSLPGLVRLLETFSQPGAFYAVHEVTILADAPQRDARRHRHPPIALPDGGKLLRTETTHYYTVRLRLARLVANDVEKAKDEPAPSEAKDEAEAPERPQGPAVY